MFTTNSSKPKRFITITILIAVLLGLFLVNTHEAKALGPSADDIAKAILTGIFNVLLTIARFSTGLIGKLFTAVLNFGFKDMSMVYTGWAIARDIVNMFFILGLVVIAFATILQIETYGMKALLPKLIIIALLINFSYLVCGIIIDASQILANYFIEAIEQKDVGMAILGSLKALDAVRGAGDATGAGPTVAITNRDFEWTVVLNMAFATAITIVAGFVLLVGAVLLFIRIGALWALIILAPFAWFLSIFPQLKTHASRWWSEFLKWSFFAPIYLFFIYLVIKISAEISNLTLMEETPEALKAISLTAMTSNWNLFFHYVFLVILLFGAPVVAMSMGIQATGVAKSIVKGGLKGAYKIPGRLRGAMVAPPGWMKAIPGVRRVASGLSKAAIWTTPAFWKQAMEERKRERMREARVPLVIGKQQDLLNRVNSLFTRRTTHAERAEQFEVQERKKEMELDTKRSESQLWAKFKDATQRKDIVDMKAAIELLVEGKDHNDLTLHTDMFDKMSYSDNELADKRIRGKRVNPLGDAATEDERKLGRAYDDAGFKDLMYQLFERAGEKESGAAAFMARIGEIGIRNGAISLYQGGKADAKGRWKRTSDAEQAEAIAAKYNAITLRDKTRIEHATTFGTQVWDYANNQYGYGELTDSARRILQGITPGDIENKRFQEARDDTTRGLAAAIKQLRTEIRQNKDTVKGWTLAQKANVSALDEKLDRYFKSKEEKKEAPFSTA